jgi:NAD(P)-dependent dehydrogenase (short-subunit alcohol dehydrogenase family)
MNIEGCVAIVTGGASGLGAATVGLLERAGCAVVVFDREDPDRSRPGGADSLFVLGDVTVPEDVARAVGAAAEIGPLRVAVNCAGIGSGQRLVRRGRDGSVTPHDLDAFRWVVDVNLVGTFDVMRSAAVEMARRPAPAGECSGVVVNTASIAAFDGQVGQTAYAAAKAAVVGLTLAAARDLADVGVRVNTIAPGLMDTPILSTVAEPTRSNLINDVVFPKRMGGADEFADLVLSIVRNDYLNGETIRLDAAARLPPRSAT